MHSLVPSPRGTVHEGPRYARRRCLSRAPPPPPPHCPRYPSGGILNTAGLLKRTDRLWDACNNHFGANPACRHAPTPPLHAPRHAPCNHISGHAMHAATPCHAAERLCAYAPCPHACAQLARHAHQHHLPIGQLGSLEDFHNACSRPAHDAHTPTHTRLHTHTHDTHTRTHAHTHTRTHAHTHIAVPSISVL
jgi:hypothetical protein